MLLKNTFVIATLLCVMKIVCDVSACKHKSYDRIKKLKTCLITDLISRDNYILAHFLISFFIIILGIQ